MEFAPGITKPQIAALVLGYLKSEKCYKAFDDFLEESQFYKKYNKNIKNMPTRVKGKSLIDIIEEYGTIDSIVQGRLEETNYFSEAHTTANLIEQIIYLLEHDTIAANSTPFSVRSEVETTPVHALPGHNGSGESEDDSSKTPKRKTGRSGSTNSKNDKDEAFDVSEVLTQTLLENHELHQKIAETINSVMKTPVVPKSVSDEHISAGASKELDAIIKTVVQRTEEDPIYNKMIDEIIGTAPLEPSPRKVTPTSNFPAVEESKSKRTNEKSDFPTNDRIDDYNKDAVRSIIEAAKNPAPQAPPENKSENGEVYVFDGTLDNYLKTSGGTNQIAPNPVYINTGGLIVMPQEPPKQFYILNNQPLINMNVSAVKTITDNDIMAMPTIIVNDETSAGFSTQTIPVKNSQNKRTKRSKTAPKPIVSETPKATVTEVLTVVTSEANLAKEKKKNKVAKSDLIISISPMGAEPKTVTASETTPIVATATKIPTPRHSHIRNLDFSTPQRGVAETKTPRKAAAETKTSPKGVVETKTPHKKKKTWDEDLRSLIVQNTVKSPTPKRKRSVCSRAKKKVVKPKNKFEEKLEENEFDEDAKKDDEEIKPEEKVNEKEEKELEKVNEKEEKELEKVNEKEEELEKVNEKEEKELEAVPLLATPKKNTIPKTPGGGDCPSANSFHCTPFTDVLEEQLKGVDLMSLPTPKLSITPGFAITPGLNLMSSDLVPYNRSTDYSTSSSYYQPSDSEQNKSLDQLIEECKRLEDTKDPKPKKSPSVKILSDVVVEQAKVPTKKEEHLKKFNHSVIGKKNLNLLKPSSSSSSSSESDSESEIEPSNDTIIQKAGTKKVDPSSISTIISTVEVKKTLANDKEAQKQFILSQLEEKRQRTINKLKEAPEVAKKIKKQTTKTPKKVVRKKINKKKGEENRDNKKIVAENKDKKEKENKNEDAKKLVTDLAERGIHLIPKKSPKKETKSEPECLIEDVVFDTKTYESCEIVVHEERPNREKTAKTYSLEFLKKGFVANLFVEELQKEVARVIKTTDFEIVLDSKNFNKNKNDESAENDSLMDYVLVGSIPSTPNESPEIKPTRGGKKRKQRSSEEDSKQTEKKSKTLELNLKLLKKIDVDTFLDKVHGE